MAGLQRNAGPCLAGVFQPLVETQCLRLYLQATTGTNGLENVPALQMAAAVPPDTNIKMNAISGRHAPQSSLEFSFVLSFFQEKERTTTHFLRLHTITQTAFIFFSNSIREDTNTVRKKRYCW